MPLFVTGGAEGSGVYDDGKFTPFPEADAILKKYWDEFMEDIEEEIKFNCTNLSSDYWFGGESNVRG